MANSMQLAGVIQGASISETSPLTLTQKVDMDVEITSAAADQEIPLGGVARPKVIVVIGGEGIQMRLVQTTGTLINAYPYALVMNLDGMTQPTVWFTNTSGVAKMIRIVAGG